MKILTYEDIKYTFSKSVFGGHFTQILSHPYVFITDSALLKFPLLLCPLFPC